MATGIVVGLSRYRDSWSSTIGASDDTYPSSTLSIDHSFPMMNPSGHHRSYSDAPDNLNRLRLPPISNLIEGAARSDLSYRPPYPSVQVQTPPQRPNVLPPVRRAPISPESAVWSPSSEPRPVYQQERTQSYESRPPAEPYYALNDYRRATIPLPQPSNPDVRHAPTYVLPHQTSDPSSPNARNSGKNVVREEIRPGKGPCYVYDDGTVCPKIINGDTVNPKWGTTKAGKPRKRLGQACNTCREKKIKCDPSFPKCTQCQKFGRECKFEAPSRAANKSPRLRHGGSPTPLQMAEDALTRTRRPSVALTEASSHSESGTISSRAAGTVDENLSPLTNDSNFLSDAPGPAKKARLTRMDSDTLIGHRLPESSYDAQYGFALETDPFRINRKLTEAYLSAYFANVHSLAFSMVPETAFLGWARQTEDKSQVSKLVLYCMLALGCSFSKSPDKHVHGRIFASIALEGVMQSFGYYSVQLIQARLIFALYEFQNGREERAWDLCGAAMRTACAMNLNTEDGVAQQLRENGTVYGLNQEVLAECIRRTFWAAYTMDNLGVACLYITTTAVKVDCYLRLPCTRRSFETGRIPQMPIFDGEVSPELAIESTQPRSSAFGYMVQIASLCCDVRTLAVKTARRTGHSRLKRYAAARDDLESQLRVWDENYKNHIRRRFGNALKFKSGALHLLYHYACMQLHRHVLHSHLSRSQVSEHARLAYHHAERTLEIAEGLVDRNSQDISDYHFAVSSPLSGYAIHYAIDILSAAGLNATLLENQSPVLDPIMRSVQLLDSLKDAWSSTKIQQKQVSDRILFVMSAAQAGIAEGKVGFCMEEPMVASLNKDEDLVYGVDRLLYLKSFGWAEQIQSLTDLSSVSSQGQRASYSMWKD